MKRRWIRENLPFPSQAPIFNLLESYLDFEETLLWKKQVNIDGYPGLAFSPHGDIYVGGLNHLCIFNKEGLEIGVQPYRSDFIAIKNNYLYLSIRDNRISKHDLEGKLIKCLDKVSFTPWAIELSEDSQVYVLNYNNRALYRFTEDLEHIDTWNLPEETNFYNLAISREKIFTITSTNHISVFNLAGEFLYTWQISQTGSSNYPRGLKASRSEIYIISQWDCVNIFTLEGEFLRKIQVPSGDIWDIAISNENLALYDYSSHTLFYYQKDLI